MSLSLQSMKFHIFTWKCSGFWSLNGNPGWYSVYGALVTIIFYVMFPLGMIMHLCYNITDLIEAIQVILFCFSALCGLKLWNIMLRKPLIDRIFILLHQLDRINGIVAEREYSKIIEAGIDRSQFWIIVCFFFYNLDSILLYVAKLISNDRTLIWSFYVPFDYRSNAIVFHSVLFYQYVATAFMAMVHASTDSIGGSMYSIIGSHLDVLGKRLSCLGVERSDCITIEEQLYRKECELELGNCIKTHRLCIQ